MRKRGMGGCGGGGVKCGVNVFLAITIKPYTSSNGDDDDDGDGGGDDDDDDDDVDGDDDDGGNKGDVLFPQA